MAIDRERVIIRFGPDALGQLASLVGRVLPGAGAAPDKDKAEQKKSTERLQRAVETGFNRLDTGISRLAVGLTGGALGLAARGFSGTADAARLSFSMEQLSRQFAAVFQPIMAGFIYASNRLTLAMQTLNGSQQNRLLGTVVGGSVGLAVGGAPGALVGGFLGNMVSGSGASSNGGTALAGALIGAYAGARFGGVYGAVAGGAGGAIAGGGWSDYYALGRAGGKSKAWSAFGSTGLTALHAVDEAALALLDAFGVKRTNLLLTPEEARRGADGLNRRAGATEEKRREPQISFAPAEEEAGSAANRIQQAVALATSGRTADMGPFGEFAKAVIDRLNTIVLVVSGKSIAEAQKIIDDADKAEAARRR
ncbi:hypothetical protein VT84_13655 [Gemmata sp. SH-PL17]|uniref:hypothetical protein n=1 Tax=Gemmata sp. SH-PL17 TaxID=1630693 RepID=UPI00078C9FDE|nr:hypothetical protein [Gemmata sp. SH-PL17]AMV25442.1 hypothetical protein VT84_13655 [Gemmata sp. SH-PL17]